MRLLALAALSRCTAFVSRAPSGARRRALASASSFAEFDAAPSRVGTQSLKWEKYSDDVLPLWVADMDFASPPCVVDALAAFLAIAVAGQLVLRARVPDPDPPAATHVSVTIPPGAVAGQTLTVDAAGQLVQFVVPAGLEAGATVQVPVGTKETA